MVNLKKIFIAISIFIFILCGFKIIGASNKSNKSYFPAKERLTIPSNSIFKLSLIEVDMLDQDRISLESLLINATAFVIDYNPITEESFLVSNEHFCKEYHNLSRPLIVAQNEEEVSIYGIESIFNWSPKLGRKQHLELYGTYAYTVSEDAQTGYQLIYVPFHKATAGINYDFQRFNTAVQAIYVGEVFTRSDNNSRYNLDAYAVANFSLGYSLGKEKNYELGARVNNVFNAEYQSVVNRWMPGRNFNMYLNLKL